jgi:hypothetical protein
MAVPEACRVKLQRGKRSEEEEVRLFAVGLELSRGGRLRSRRVRGTDDFSKLLERSGHFLRYDLW